MSENVDHEPQDASDAVIVSERVIDASRERVFRAFSDPDLLAR